MQSVRKPGVLGQTLFTFCGNSSGYVVAIVTGIVVARSLGPAGKGVAAYAALVMALFTTFASGMQGTILYECGKRGETQERVYGAALRLLGLTMLPAAAVLITLATLDHRHASLAYVACAVPFAVYCQISCSIFLLHNDVRSTVIQNAIPTFGVALLTIPALTVFHGGLTAVLAIWAAMFVASGLYCVVRLNAYLPTLSLQGDWALVRDEGSFALKGGLTGLAAFLNLRIDVFVVSAMLDARTLGVYTLAVASGEMMWQISRPLVWTTMGRIANGERAEAIRLTNTVTRNILAVECVLGVVVYFVAPFAVRLVYGDAFAQSGLVMRWLMPGLILYAAQGTLSYFIAVKEGRPAAILGVQVTSVLACAAISVLTIRQLGIFGAALATNVTYCCAAAAAAVLYARFTGTALADITLLRREDLARFARILERVFPGRRVPAAEGAGTS